ncbi:DUF2165 domain-containing protein [Thalassococcus sp. S3]|uniref:DUF2165 domain-containing protein n=1 Tax=Thalassococcus sp. S3 TaxID=2017482 RepID=UPI00102483A6|nr:DUF2165 domain-containing protein [Thalassococcus sp. S3]QBF33679.1 hypothetical protein CFI11_21030 [Thalassococcus sp. S3]
MLDLVILLSQAVSVALMAAWLTLGVRDNILHPSVNEIYTAQVMQMSRMREDFPDEYALVAHRAVSSRATQQFAFRTVVVAELLTTIMLWIGVITLVMGLFGMTPTETGRALAMIGTLMFTCIWAGFLVVGNHFSYWFCHEDAQNTHYQMTLWGLGNLIFLAAV